VPLAVFILFSIAVISLYRERAMLVLSNTPEMEESHSDAVLFQLRYLGAYFFYLHPLLATPFL